MASDLQVQYSFITPASIGTFTVVAAQPGQRICVLQCCVITGGANNVKFQSGGTTDISALFPLAQNGGFVLPYTQVGWMRTAIGESLDFVMTGAASTAVQVVWCPFSS